MTVLYLEALAAIAVSLSVLMAGAWMVQHAPAIPAGWIRSGPFPRSGRVTGIPRWSRSCCARDDRYRDYQSVPVSSRCRRKMIPKVEAGF